VNNIPTTRAKFAEVFGIEDNVSYGFLRFLADTKLVKTGKLSQPKGSKGKPKTIYHLDDGIGARLVAYLQKHLNELSVPIPVEAPVDISLAPLAEVMPPTPAIAENTDESPVSKPEQGTLTDAQAKALGDICQSSASGHPPIDADDNIIKFQEP
jgi:hypothetical protein